MIQTVKHDVITFTHTVVHSENTVLVFILCSTREKMGYGP